MRTFDSSVEGLGECPYASGAKGNVATEADCERIPQLGLETAIDTERRSEAVAFVGTLGSTR